MANIPRGKEAVRWLASQHAPTTYLLLLVVGIGGVLLSFLLGHLDAERRASDARSKATTELARISAMLEGQVSSTFGTAEGIAQILKIDGDIQATHFSGMAQMAIAASPYIRNVALLPGDVIRNIYPLEGNDAALGTNLAQIPEQYAAILRARESGHPLLAGPVKLVQGGYGLIYRHPIFTTSASNERHYWGTMSIVANLDGLIRASGITNENTLRLSLRGRDGLGSAGEIIWGDDTVLENDPVSLAVSVPGGVWQLSAVPLNGWPSQSPPRSQLFLISIANTVLVLFFIAQLMRRNRLIRQRNESLSREIAEHKATEEALGLQQALLQTIVDHAPSLIYLFDKDGRLKWCNRCFEKAVGYRLNTTQGMPRERFQPAELAQQQRHNDLAVLANGSVMRFEEQLDDHGRERTYLTTKCPLPGPDGQPHAILGISTDITEIKQTTEQLRLAGVVMANTADAVMITDAHSTILSVNRAFTDITGYSADEAVGQSPRLLRSDRQPPEFYRAMWETLRSTGVWRGEIWNRRKNGALYPEWLTINAVNDDKGNHVNYVAVFSDISAIKHSQAELERLAHYDPLTDLPNRTLFHHQLQHDLDRALRYDRQLAVLILDLDGFKTVNDSLGHPVGDRLLQQAAERFKCCLRVEDTVSRLGGDEFAVILSDLGQDTDAIAVVKKILQALQEPFDLDGNAALVTASIGIAIAPTDGRTSEELVRNADTAMYGAKEGGRNSYRFYQAEMTRKAQDRLTRERALRRALEEREFELWYQPKLDLRSGRVSGAEALLRWKDPQRGMISPAEFIPLAERTALIIPIGELVLDTVCAQISQWRGNGLETGRIAINVAALQIERSDYVNTLACALARHGLPPEVLEVEVTESLIMENPEHARQVIHAIQDLGVTTAVDDFGTGYSSLAYLKVLPINNLKVDRAFVSDLPYDENDVAITKAIVGLGQTLGFEITAEGIETAEQLEFLRSIGCNHGQGYLFGKPMPVAQFEDWIIRGQQGEGI